MRRTLRLDGGENVDVLGVPFFFQPEKDSLCFPVSVLMCLNYFNNMYEIPIVKKNTPKLDLQEISKLTKTRNNLGTIVDNGLINKLNKSIGSLQFEYKKNCTISELEKRFNDDIPSIVLYDSSYLIYDIPGSNHAGVVVGFADDLIILNNPWSGPYWTVGIKEFQRSWELEGNRAILISPKSPEELKIQETLKVYENDNIAT